MSAEVDNKVRICVWADGEWCYMEAIQDYGHKSDDYAVITCNLGDEEEAIAAYERA